MIKTISVEKSIFFFLSYLILIDWNPTYYQFKTKSNNDFKHDFVQKLNSGQKMM